MTQQVKDAAVHTSTASVGSAHAGAWNKPLHHFFVRQLLNSQRNT